MILVLGMELLFPLIKNIKVAIHLPSQCRFDDSKITKTKFYICSLQICQFSNLNQNSYEYLPINTEIIKIATANTVT